jgi:hypothetical protein
VADFLAEIYLSRANGVDASVARARAAAEELTGEGTPVRYVSSIFVPEDETCFFLYQADSADAVREAARRASLVFERVSEAVAESKGTLQ